MNFFTIDTFMVVLGIAAILLMLIGFVILFIGAFA